MGIFRRMALLTPMVSAVIIAGGVAVVLAYVVLPSTNQGPAPAPPRPSSIPAPDVGEVTIAPTATAILGHRLPEDSAPSPTPEQRSQTALLHGEQVAGDATALVTPTPRRIRRPPTALPAVTATAPHERLDVPTSEPLDLGDFAPGELPSVTQAPAPRPEPTRQPLPTPTNTPRPISSPRPSPTSTSRLQATLEPSPTPTRTPVPSSPTPSPTILPSPTSTPTTTASPTMSPPPSSTPLPTPEPTTPPQPTTAPLPTPTLLPTVTAESTLEPTEPASPTPTRMPKPTRPPRPQRTPTVTSTPELEPVPTLGGP